MKMPKIFRPLNQISRRHKKAPEPEKKKKPEPIKKGDSMTTDKDSTTHGRHKKGTAPDKVMKLQKAIDEHDEIIVVGATAGIGPYPGTVEIDGEKIVYAMASDTSLHGCRRGHDGTTAAAHELDANVTFLGLSSEPVTLKHDLNVNKVSPPLTPINPEPVSVHRARQTDPVVNSIDKVINKTDDPLEVKTEAGGHPIPEKGDTKEHADNKE